MKTLLLFATLFATVAVRAQKEIYPATEAALTAKIMQMDNDAFEHYNSCNLEKFKTYFTDDLEFYHDKGGYTTGVAKFIDSTNKYICNNLNGKVLRKAVKDSFKVYTMGGYGALLTGDHDFYIVKNGIEKKTGTAKFTHLWILKDGYWKMARVLSYDHHAAE
ncbi:nuclear transport factor 2 family protein [Flavobacterium sp. DG1-102-2]|uniref:nuclear transport factor 2 family protein n=1 Tax=Flavobacterium sp. DG1-102-2 TaxID=3081663 RepID=UPI00294911BE|nr:nuclear transport factor 2 family protein [Flavobacterium sp. DG1-102-2]MDV6169852.1 nuclear transport factor 2 family protein [Flavobacterium sp. DG1-102-2]